MKKSKKKFSLIISTIVAISVIVTWISTTNLKGIDNFRRDFKEMLFPDSNPSIEELDVMEEWVLLINKYDDSLKGINDRSKFIKLYENSRHWQRWDSTEIVYVRNPVKKREWLIVIDAIDNKGEKYKIENAKQELLDYCDKNNLKRNLKPWINNSRPFFYDKNQYIETYGKFD